jgi:ATP-dependent Clp protease protease subunit
MDGGIKGQATDIKIHSDWMIKTKNKLNQIYSELTGNDITKIKNDMERDYYMSAYEAIDYGIIDKVM